VSGCGRDDPLHDRFFGTDGLNGIVYSGPITINTTRCLRAVAVVAGKISSLPVTHSYIFLDQVLSQPATLQAFPTIGDDVRLEHFPPASSVPGLVPTDYAMDSDPLRVDPNNPGSAIDPVKQQRFMDGMRELPLVSVTVPMIDMFGANGLYYYPNVTNKISDTRSARWR
jgi:hypothetical protein